MHEAEIQRIVNDEIHVLLQTHLAPVLLRQINLDNVSVATSDDEVRVREGGIEESLSQSGRASANLVVVGNLARTMPQTDMTVPCTVHLTVVFHSSGQKMKRIVVILQVT